MIKNRFIIKGFKPENQSDFLLFLCNNTLTGIPYTFVSVHELTETQYERNHDFIQIQFPNDMPSKAVPSAQLIKKMDIELVANSEILSTRFKLGFVRFLRSIGLALNMTHDRIIIWDQDMFSLKVVDGNHNLRRISRVLRSLKLFRFDPYSNTLFRFLIIKQHEGVINVSEETLKHWHLAK